MNQGYLLVYDPHIWRCWPYPWPFGSKVQCPFCLLGKLQCPPTPADLTSVACADFVAGTALSEETEETLQTHQTRLLLYMGFFYDDNAQCVVRALESFGSGIAKSNYCSTTLGSGIALLPSRTTLGHRRWHCPLAAAAAAAAAAQDH